MKRKHPATMTTLAFWVCVICLLVFFGTFPVRAAVVTDNQITNIDFKRNGKGQGALGVELAKAQSLVDIRRSGKKLYIDIVGAGLSDDMVYVLNVADFATAVTSVETFRIEKGSRLVLTMSEAFLYDYTLDGSLLSVVVEGAPENTEQKKAASIAYNGKPISINFQDVPVRNVLQLIAEYNDFNLVVSDSVQGNVTLRLDDVPWPQVLDIMLQVKGLDKRVQDSVVLVAPKQELALNEQFALEAKRKEEELTPLQSAIIQVNYAKATDLADLLLGSEGGISMLSARGSLHVDARTNSLILNDLPESLANIRHIVEVLDIPVKQVQIEARIVSVDDKDVEEMGVRWGILSSSGNTTVGGSIESNLNSIGVLDKTSDVSDFLNVNLAATQPGASSLAFQVAKLGDILLDLELSALQAEDKAEIISSPRLMTTNKQTAYIEQGTEIPYLEASSSGAVSVGFKKAVLSLMVTPQITPDDNLVLDLVVTQDSKGDTVTTGTGEAVSIKTQRIGTQVLVENGETVVLGGIFQNELKNKVEKVPLLGDLPVLGALFRHKLKELKKRELLIFVTPKIVMQ
ncbi:Type IV pilus biogenesis protein PilQ [Photobacterium marinum]|uniref:Type IV pilus biogenesis protein PilQ n=1 Tax=Photobacterium marinum TaxID=1056511 RepID=L8J8Y6_9GAMM|nr:type IV pilus secretin PilQ family protein [Photobacterium marinum]ELR63937.1 Type IV pilus biogenesis protein PilQ [Photobacterium marinum]